MDTGTKDRIMWIITGIGVAICVFALTTEGTFR